MRQTFRPARRAWQAFVFAATLAGSAHSASACPPDFPWQGLTGRGATALFSNKKLLWGRHEPWAERFIGLELYAGYTRETDEYGHNVLGPLRDAKGLTIHVRRGGAQVVGQTCPVGHWLSEGFVFEGVKPVLRDLTRDGLPEIITTVSSQAEGARVSVFDRHGNHIASTPPIGTRFRWLGLIGAEDFDGDGYMEIAYIDRPHLAKILRIWRFRNGAFEQVASMPGLTNHRIGEDFMTSGIRDCGQGPQIVTANANWSRIMVSTFDGDQIQTRDIGAFDPKLGLSAALACEVN
ncbi:MAG: VCBS repeat-containing protein [Epibacterium sp.]|nr:VCBS repeat-containing protein [Epibacterium sp.]